MVKYLETRGKGSSLSFATISRTVVPTPSVVGSVITPPRPHFSYKDPGNLTAKRAALKRRI